MTLPGTVLHARARTVPLTVSALVAGAVLATWSAFERRPAEQEQGIDALTRLPLAILWPLVAAAVIGVGLRSRSVELESAASRNWWPSRAVHLVALTVLAAGLLALAVPPGGLGAFGTGAMVRNTLGAVGATALGAVLLGARLGWPPVLAYTALVWAAVGTVPALPRHPAGAAWWAWPVQPDAQTAAWWTAVLLFVVGSGCYAAYGARPEGGRA